jgi:membrane protein implicated in regulation of membrane protease activity
MGIIFSQFKATNQPLISASLAVLGGLIIASVVLWLLRGLFSHTQSSSESKIASVIGMEATIITPITENGVGEIAYVQAGTRYTAPARLESGVASSCASVASSVRSFTSCQTNDCLKSTNHR